MQKKILIIILIILGVLALSIGGFFIWYHKTPPNQPEPKAKSIDFQFIKEIEIAEGHQVRMLFANNRFYITYKKPDKSIAVRIYNPDLELEGEEILLKTIEGADYKIVFSSEHFYLSDAYYLRKYDLNWNEIKFVSYFGQLPSDVSKLWEHGVDDMILSSGNNSIYLGVAMGNAPPESIKKENGKKPDLPDNLYLQEFDLELELKNKVMLNDVGNVPSSSLIKENDELIIITGDKHWDDSSLVMLRYDQNRNLLERKVISAEVNANEEFPMTVLSGREVYYVGYHHITGDLSQPTTLEPDRSIEVIVKAFDTKWNLLGQLPKESDTSNTFQEIPPWFDLVLVENKIYLVSDSNQDKIILKEFLIKK